MRNIVIVLSVALNIILFLAVFTPKKIDQKSSKDKFVDQEEKYPYLSKRVLNEFPNDILINFRDLRRELNSTIEPYKNDFGFYFEYLPTGVSIGAREKDEFNAASTFKVPMVMAYYSRKERLVKTTDPDVVLTKDMLNDKFGDLYMKGEGFKINIKDAIRYALVYSDNTAIAAVASQIGEDDINYVANGLDIDIKNTEDTPVITLKHLSSVLKALFFSSIINKDHSQEVLEYLTQSDFSYMLESPVPKEIRFAHKIGIVDGKLYTDCGIFYMPRRPYVLCAVSAGTKEDASARMGDLSRIVYKYLKTVNIEK